MAKDTRKVVYYKGRKYFVNRTGEQVSEIEDTTTPTVKKLVETSKIMTEEEYQEWSSKQRSQHVNWIK